MKKLILNKTLSLIQGDITERKVDAIVNAANSHLIHGGGVAGAILKKGGTIIQEESNKIDFVPVGNAVVTSAGNLACHSIIHTVGPRMGEGEEDTKLKNSVRSVFRLATEKKFSSISIPAISSGIFGFPKDRCAKILVSEALKFAKENKNTTIELIEFCIFDDQTYGHFEKEFNSIA